jgi:putative endonuclease
MLRCGDGTLYTGIATDVTRRMAEHERGRRGSRYLRGRGPLQLVFQCEVEGRSLASRAEHRIKGLSRQEKERLLATPARMHELLDYCRAGNTSTG